MSLVTWHTLGPADSLPKPPPLNVSTDSRIDLDTCLYEQIAFKPEYDWLRHRFPVMARRLKNYVLPAYEGRFAPMLIADYARAYPGEPLQRDQMPLMQVRMMTLPELEWALTEVGAQALLRQESNDSKLKRSDWNIPDAVTPNGVQYPRALHLPESSLPARPLESWGVLQDGVMACCGQLVCQSNGCWIDLNDNENDWGVVKPYRVWYNTPYFYESAKGKDVNAVQDLVQKNIQTGTAYKDALHFKRIDTQIRTLLNDLAATIATIIEEEMDDPLSFLEAQQQSQKLLSLTQLLHEYNLPQFPCSVAPVSEEDAVELVFNTTIIEKRNLVKEKIFQEQQKEEAARQRRDVAKRKEQNTVAEEARQRKLKEEEAKLKKQENAKKTSAPKARKSKEEEQKPTPEKASQRKKADEARARKSKEEDETKRKKQENAKKTSAPKARKSKEKEQKPVPEKASQRKEADEAKARKSKEEDETKRKKQENAKKTPAPETFTRLNTEKVDRKQIETLIEQATNSSEKYVENLPTMLRDILDAQSSFEQDRKQYDVVKKIVDDNSKLNDDVRLKFSLENVSWDSAEEAIKLSNEFQQDILSALQSVNTALDKKTPMDAPALDIENLQLQEWLGVNRETQKRVEAALAYKEVLESNTYTNSSPVVLNPLLQEDEWIKTYNSNDLFEKLANVKTSVKDTDVSVKELNNLEDTLNEKRRNLYELMQRRIPFIVLKQKNNLAWNVAQAETIGLMQRKMKELLSAQKALNTEILQVEDALEQYLLQQETAKKKEIEAAEEQARLKKQAEEEKRKEKRKKQAQQEKMAAEVDRIRQVITQAESGKELYDKLVQDKFAADGLKVVVKTLGNDGLYQAWFMQGMSDIVKKALLDVLNNPDSSSSAITVREKLQNIESERATFKILMQQRPDSKDTFLSQLRSLTALKPLQQFLNQLDLERLDSKFEYITYSADKNSVWYNLKDYGKRNVLPPDSEILARQLRNTIEESKRNADQLKSQKSSNDQKRAKQKAKKNQVTANILVVALNRSKAKMPEPYEKGPVVRGTSFKWNSSGALGSCAYDSVLAAMFKTRGTFFHTMVSEAINVRKVNPKCSDEEARELDQQIIADINRLSLDIALPQECSSRKLLNTCLDALGQEINSAADLLQLVLDFYGQNNAYMFVTQNAVKESMKDYSKKDVLIVDRDINSNAQTLPDRLGPNQEFILLSTFVQQPPSTHYITVIRDLRTHFWHWIDGNTTKLVTRDYAMRFSQTLIYIRADSVKDLSVLRTRFILTPQQIQASMQTPFPAFAQAQLNAQNPLIDEEERRKSMAFGK